MALVAPNLEEYPDNPSIVDLIADGKWISVRDVQSLKQEIKLLELTVVNDGNDIEVKAVHPHKVLLNLRELIKVKLGKCISVSFLH